MDVRRGQRIGSLSLISSYEARDCTVSPSPLSSSTKPKTLHVVVTPKRRRGCDTP
jgi:hypothetical protein